MGSKEGNPIKAFSDSEGNECVTIGAQACLGRLLTSYDYGTRCVTTY